MKIKSLTTLFGLFLFFLSTIVLADIPLTIINPINTAVNSKIIQLVKENVNLSSADYNSARIKIISRHANRYNYLLVFLLSAQTYSLSVTKIDINENFHVTSVTPHYHLQKQDLPGLVVTNAECPNPNVEFIAATPLDSYPTAKAAIVGTSQKAQLYGYQVKTLLGDEATVANYLSYLNCPHLKGFYHIGHGDPDGIMLYDDVLSSDIIKEQLQKKLAEQVVVFFNSCEVFNNPLKDSLIQDADAQKYSGGISPLRIGPSELASRCFWESAFKHFPMAFSINFCNKTQDVKDKFGIGGLGGNFLRFPGI